MVLAEQSIVRGQFRSTPILPAGARANGNGQFRKLRRPRQQPIGLAGRMLRNATAAEIGLRKISSKRRAAEQSAFHVATAERESQRLRRCSLDRLEIAAIGIGDGQRVENLGRNDMIRNQPIFGNPARPAAGIEPDQPGERPRRRGESARRCPDDAGRSLAAVVDAQLRERHRQGLRRAFLERAFPQSVRETGKQFVAGLKPGSGALRQQQ